MIKVEYNARGVKIFVGKEQVFQMKGCCTGFQVPITELRYGIEWVVGLLGWSAKIKKKKLFIEKVDKKWQVSCNDVVVASFRRKDDAFLAASNGVMYGEFETFRKRKDELDES